MNELKNWREEKGSAFLYRVVAEKEAGTARQGLFLELAREADKQAEIWAKKIRVAGGKVPTEFSPELRSRIVAALVRRLGPRPIRSVLAAMKVRGMSLYSVTDPRHYVPDSASGMEGRHSGLSGGGNLRAAVFGVNDGLVSNASLIFGVAGATADPKIILLSGVAGLLAGAFSMAAGEYVSVRSQREMYEYQIGLEREELGQYPEEEASELALIYQARGIPEDEAQRMANVILVDPTKALDTLAREELGLNPADLGSPWGAAIFSFISFALGAVMPLLPYLIHVGPKSLYVSVALTAGALFGVGVVISLFTGRQAVRGGLRMLGIGGVAGLLTYLIGRLLGVSLA
jgi:vacuolar iron transporter family protein